MSEYILIKEKQLRKKLEKLSKEKLIKRILDLEEKLEDERLESLNEYS